MPRVSLISDESRPPLIPDKTECQATIETCTFKAGGATVKPTLDIEYRLVSDQTLVDPETGDVYPLNGRKIRQTYWLTDAAAWRMEPVLQATGIPYQKIPIEGQPKQFKLDFDTDDLVHKTCIVPIVTESYVDKQTQENRVVNRIGLQVMPLR